MSKKFGASRKRAFLGYLAQTGNQTLSAERARVSRSWVCLHRSTDADFDAACRRAIGEAAKRLDSPLTPTLSLEERGGDSGAPAAGAGACAPPAGWGFLDGAELVVAGSNRRHAQVRRARVRQWTARVEKRFLAALAATCNVKAACAEVGMWPPSAYNHRRRWPAFAEKWDDAIETGYARIGAALVENACNLFSDAEVPLDVEMPGMTVDHAIHLLHMNKHKVHGLGKKPGLNEGPVSNAEIAQALERRLKWMDRQPAKREVERFRKECRRRGGWSGSG